MGKAQNILKKIEKRLDYSNVLPEDTELDSFNGYVYGSDMLKDQKLFRHISIQGENHLAQIMKDIIKSSE